MLAFDEPMSVGIAVGVALVSAGVAIVGLARAADRRSLPWAAATGVSIAACTVVDAQGVRASPAAKAEWRAGLAAGALSIVPCGLALGACRLGDTPRLAALRETSILAGVGLSARVLKEPVGRARLAGAAAIFAGAVVLLTAR